MCIWKNKERDQESYQEMPTQDEEGSDDRSVVDKINDIFLGIENRMEEATDKRVIFFMKHPLIYFFGIIVIILIKVIIFN